MMHYNYNDQYFENGMNGWHAQSYDIVTSELKKAWNSKAQCTTLDMGCGDGFYGHYLVSFSSRLDGIDVSDEVKFSPNRKFYSNLFTNDLGGVMEINCKYDLIFSSEVIEHVESYTAFIKNAYNFLKDGGEIFLTTTTFSCSLPIYVLNETKRIKISEINKFIKGWAGNYKSRTEFLKNLWAWTKGHYHGFSKKQLKTAFEKNGFKVTKIEYLYAQPFIYDSFFQNPFKNVKLRFVVVPVARLLGILVKAINFTVKHLGIYGSNVMVIAIKDKATTPSNA